ncbi:CAP domain-containing protein [Pseudomonas sp. CrR14]|nr:CAP domain-containing protein [Pseudomonas sp. CrR14]
MSDSPKHVRQVAVVVMLLCTSTVGSAWGDDSEQLTRLINNYREMGQGCDGQPSPAAGPLAPDRRLAGQRANSSAQLQQALQQAGYQAAAVQLIRVTGPTSAEAAMVMLRQSYCKQLLDAQFADVGVLHEGNSWQVVLGRALLPARLGDWQEEGKAILAAVNQARGTARRCGDQPFDAAEPLTWSEPLGQAALAHSRDMAMNSLFSHQGSDRSLVGARATAAGYAWTVIGENIAAGQGRAKQVVEGWLASPSHCYNLMNPDFREMGAAYASNPQSQATIYWTQVFGAVGRSGL